MAGWVAKSDLELSVARALAAENLHAVTYDEAVNIVVNAYIGYKNAYQTVARERSELTGAFAAITAERDGYVSAVDTVGAERHELYGRIATLKSERDGYKTALEAFGHERSGFLGRIGTLEGERDGYKGAYDDVTGQLGELQTRTGTLVGERDGYKSALEAFGHERSDLLGRIGILEGERDGYKAALDAFGQERSDLLGRSGTLESERDGYKAALEAFGHERSDLLGRIGTLEAQSMGFQGALATVTRERDRARSQAQSGGALMPLGPRQPRGLLQAEPKSPPAILPHEPRDVAMTSDFAFDRMVVAGQAAEVRGDREEAISQYLGAMRLMHRYGPAKTAADAIAKSLFAEGIGARDRGDDLAAQSHLVRSLELNPDAQEVRDALQALLDRHPGRDLTQECLIFPDGPRATRFYRDAIQTCLDFVVYGGVNGDILEFGVLAGWTARHFAEVSRDMAFYSDVYLFDSFEGLPRAKWDVDRASYDVVRGVWREEMKLPDSFEHEIGSTIDVHVGLMLAQVISPERIKIRKGFYSDTLQAPLSCKAAIVHLDCDLYQSTVEVFSALERDDVLQDGTVLMFDDWNCNRGNPAFGQRRAFAEFLDRNAGRWSASHYLNYGFNCAAFILHKTAAT